MLALQLAAPPIRIHAPGRIVAIGDIHGDAQAFLKTLQNADLVDNSATCVDDATWTGGDTTLVQTGDVLDRGPDEQSCLDMLRKLRAEAPRAGGRVVCVLGNHEVMNVLGCASPYVHPAAATAFGPDRRRAFAAGGALARELADWYVAVVVGDTCFVHAHLPADATETSLDALNLATQQWLRGERAASDAPAALLNTGYNGDSFSVGAPTLTASPVWGRSLGRRVVPLLHCDALRRTLRRLRVARCVVGHTPQLEGVNAACDCGLVWRIDTGMSAFVTNGEREALELSPDGTIAILGDGGRREVQPLVRPLPSGGAGLLHTPYATGRRAAAAAAVGKDEDNPFDFM